MPLGTDPGEQAAGGAFAENIKIAFIDPLSGPFASTGTKDPALPKTKYVLELAAPDTVDTMPEETLLALSENEGIGDLVPGDGGDNEAVLAEFRAAGVDLKALAQRLQDEGADKFVKSWESLLERIEEKSRAVAAG